jgi:hypothetical protein
MCYGYVFVSIVLVPFIKKNKQTLVSVSKRVARVRMGAQMSAAINNKVFT